MIELYENKSIVHRDIKPQNIFMHTLNNGENVYKITCFDPAEFFTSNSLNETSIAFMQPEINGTSENEKPMQEFNMWSIGVTIFYLITGGIPFKLDKDPQE